MTEKPMKKWHMEGIVISDSSVGHKFILPDEDRKYRRFRTRSANLPKEGVLISLIRNMLASVLRFF